MKTAPKGTQRFAEIVELVAHSRVAPSSQQIFERLALPRSSGYDLLHGLAEERFLHRKPTGRWVLGEALQALALARFGLGSVASNIEPTLAELQEETQEAVVFAVPHRDAVLITHVSKSLRSMGIVAEVGTEIPIHRSAAGYMLATGLNTASLRKLFASAKASSRGKTVVRFAQFIHRVREAGRRGFAIEVEQAQTDCCSIAAAVADAQGRSLAAVSLILPSTRLSANQDTLVSLVRAAAIKLTQQLRCATAEKG